VAVYTTVQKISSEVEAIMKKMSILTLLAVLTISVWLPVGASAQEWQRRRIERSSVYYGQNNDYWRERRRRIRRMRMREARMYGNTYRGYSSYATNRRYRLQQQTYWLNGRRYTRTIRVYF
jgi:hypothetical protein